MNDLKFNNEEKFFHSENWKSILASGLEAKFTEIVSVSGNTHLLTTFLKGPFKILYPGFPIGDAPSNILDAMLDNAKCSEKKMQWDMFRLWQSATVPPWEPRLLPGTILPETVIDNLKSWKESQLASSIRRNVRKAKKSGLRVEPATPHDSSAIFELYRGIIRKNDGSLRYTPRYFDHLIRIARNDRRIQVHIARTSEGKPSSMLIWATHGSCAYYLHGATDPRFSAMRPSDLLMFNAITDARDNNITAFSFLPSPPKQQGLIRFKEKWGGRTIQTPVYDYFPRSAKGKGLKLLLTARKHFTR